MGVIQMSDVPAPKPKPKAKPKPSKTLKPAPVAVADVEVVKVIRKKDKAELQMTRKHYEMYKKDLDLA